MDVRDGYMAFTEDANTYSGSVTGLKESKGNVSFKYNYVDGAVSWAGEFKGQVVDGLWDGIWEEHASIGRHLVGRASLARVVAGDRCILAGTWKDGKATKPKAVERWVVDVRTDITLKG